MKMLTMSVIGMLSAATIAVPAAAQNQQPNPQIDYPGFLKLTEELEDYRATRLITLDQFNQMANEENALILDTRSAAAFHQGHIKGAVNLPFSDFTEAKLAQYLGDKKRPILIYCNNNFRDNVVPVARKFVQLALNIPTFINLHGYGYRNIYELNDVVLMSDPRVQWVSTTIGS